jgi:hypothetical protein
MVRPDKPGDYDQEGGIGALSTEGVWVEPPTRAVALARQVENSASIFSFGTPRPARIDDRAASTLRRKKAL